MNKTETKLTKEEIKNEIRKRYQGADQNQISVIPAREQNNFFNTDTPANVAVYARVSTGDPNQTSSYELQKNHYQDEINKRPNWNLVKIYADEGISGTSLAHRDAFKEMIEDCKAHKMNLIITKSVSRFARNIVDCISYVRMLAELTPPIGIYFETERIYTLDDKNEMSLSFLATLAQEESHNKSQSMNISLEMRFKRGIFLTPKLLGYDKDEDGNLVINEEEAKIVRLIFFMYLYGYSVTAIAEKLTALTCTTKKGNAKWSSSSVIGILQNERHCGDIIARKTYTPNYLTHKTKRNKGDRQKYHTANHHEAIISRDDWLAVQKKLRYTKYGSVHYLPTMQIIPSGVLEGYILIHPNWSGFTADTYINASRYCKKSKPHHESLHRNPGDFDLSKYQLVHLEYFINQLPYQLTINKRLIKFSIQSLRSLMNHPYIEILFNPVLGCIAVRQCQASSPYRFIWSNLSRDNPKTRQLGGTQFLPIIYQLMNWNINYRYVASGRHIQTIDEDLIIFDLRRARIITKEYIKTTNGPTEEGTNNPHQVHSPRTITGYPTNWELDYGQTYYDYLTNLSSTTLPIENLKSNVTPISYDEDPLNITSEETISNNIEELFDHFEMK